LFDYLSRRFASGLWGIWCLSRRSRRSHARRSHDCERSLFILASFRLTAPG